jgi:hypothetical protein
LPRSPRKETPPPEVFQRFNSQQQAELARLFRAPKVRHKLRLNNVGPHPLTTAPALILRGERVLAQGMMTYTPRGAESDLDTTTAVNVLVRKDERETGRIPNALNWQGSSYARVSTLRSSVSCWARPTRLCRTAGPSS